MTPERSKPTLGERLHQLRAKTTIEEMATKVGASKATIVNYESGKRLPDVDFLAAFAQAVNADFLALIRLRLEASDAAISQQTAVDMHKALGHILNAGPAESADTWHGRRGYLTEIPLYNVRASAGAGSALDDERVIGTRSFLKSWVTEYLRMNPKDLALVVVHGTSMEPTISDGDLLMVNLAQNRLSRDDIYLLREGDDLMVKRLQKQPGGGLRMISDNPHYPPLELDATVLGSGELTIIGRGVWWAHTNGP